MGVINFFNQIIKKPLSFLGDDTEELYKRNLEIMPDDWHYRTKKITYKINGFNYRTLDFNEIKWEKSIVILGCDNVFGVGVDEDETISSYLQKITGMPVINMGVPGCSNELILNNCVYIINNYRTPYAFIVGWANLKNFLYYIDDKQYNITNSNFDKDIDIFDNFNKKIVKTINNSIVNNISYINNINITFKKHLKVILKNRARFIDFMILNHEVNALVMNCVSFINDNKSRNLMYSGADNNEKIAKYLSGNI